MNFDALSWTDWLLAIAGLAAMVFVIRRRFLRFTVWWYRRQLAAEARREDQRIVQSLSEAEPLTASQAEAIRVMPRLYFGLEPLEAEKPQGRNPRRLRLWILGVVIVASAGAYFSYPWTLDQCMTAASKRPTTYGVRLAADLCNRRFESSDPAH